jgi:hypothetical protein
LRQLWKLITSAVALKGNLRKPKGEPQCTRCRSGDHKTYLCTKYAKSSPPEQNSSNNSGYDGKQIKRQKSFDTQQQKN